MIGWIEKLYIKEQIEMGKQLKLFKMTVGEVKDNAEYNLRNENIPLQVKIGMSQLENYNIAIKLGATDEDKWEDWEKEVRIYKDE